MSVKGVAIAAARNAGRLLKRRLGKSVSIEYKGALDLVTEMDRASEALIVGEIRKAFPGHSILAEESGPLAAKAPDKRGYRWIIDPLDGTTNYAHGLPFFCVSIALESARGVEFGVVYNPMLDETFWAGRSTKAYLNDTRICVSKVDKLDGSLLATGFPYDIRTSRLTNLDNFSAFAVRAQAIRRMGAAALDLCYTAFGRFDGFWEMKLKPWDVAAATLIVEKAGGSVTDFKGGPFMLEAGQCLASNGLIHDSMIDVLAGRHKPSGVRRGQG